MVTDYVGQAYRINAAIGVVVLEGWSFHMGDTFAPFRWERKLLFFPFLNCF